MPGPKRTDTERLGWHRSHMGHVESHCGRYFISPNYCGSTVVQDYKLGVAKGNRVAPLGGMHATQRDAKFCAEQHAMEAEADDA